MSSNRNYAQFKVLVVDDHQLSQKLVTKQLEIIGFKDIDVVFNGEEAARQIGKVAYDIVFLDWSMPVMDGLTFLKQYASQDQYKDVAFVMVSAEAQSSQIMETIKAGAISYITKPLSLPDLQNKVEKIVDWKNKRK